SFAGAKLDTFCEPTKYFCNFFMPENIPELHPTPQSTQKQQVINRKKFHTKITIFHHHSKRHSPTDLHTFIQ
ncbi:hypothetical protein, partial [Xylanibacter muris]|uniref:hypothetical protein n=1 Tax=Xylanibacter muris TaxID=2736290 RepID=UPI0025A1A2EF